MMAEQFIPPLIVSKYIGTYHFQDGNYVAIVGHWKDDIEKVLDTAQAMIDMKRAELAKQAQRPEHMLAPKEER